MLYLLHYSLLLSWWGSIPVRNMFLIKSFEGSELWQETLWGFSPISDFVKSISIKARLILGVQSCKKFGLISWIGRHEFLLWLDWIEWRGLIGPKFWSFCVPDSPTAASQTQAVTRLVTDACQSAAWKDLHSLSQICQNMSNIWDM